jgi:hypothetical protein
MTENELDLKIKGYPTIFFYAGGDKKDFTGGRDLE